MTNEECQVAAIICDCDSQDHEKATSIIDLMERTVNSRVSAAIALCCQTLKRDMGHAEIADDLWARMTGKKA